MSAAKEVRAPDFFQPGRTYRIADGVERADFLDWIFRAEHIGTHDGQRIAFGYLTNGHPEATWNAHLEGEDSWRQGWADVTADMPAPDFFQPGHAYTHRDGTTFRCFTTTVHPNGERLAIGWHTDLGDWTFLAYRDINAWRYEYDGCEPPGADTPCAVCGVGMAAHGATWQHLYMAPSAREGAADMGGEAR